jgi:hypothetical protein
MGSTGTILSAPGDLTKSRGILFSASWSFPKIGAFSNGRPEPV